MSILRKLTPILLKSLSDKQYSMLEYLYRLGKLPDLQNPRTFNEKILWIKLHYRNHLLVQCTDKFSVRDYVNSILSEEVLVPLLGVYDHAQDIPYDALPDQFILKTTHGSGWNIICQSKSKFHRQAETAKLSKWLQSNFYYEGREWPYKDIKPRVICETLLLDDEGNIPPDYKVFCFHGKPKFIQVDFTRFTTHTQNIYDLDWNRVPFRFEYPNNEQADPNPPAALQDLLAMAQSLSSPFPFVRIDMYILRNKILFGELTFYPGRGQKKFTPPEYDHILGDYLDLKDL